MVITCIWDLQAMARPKKEASEQHIIPLKVSCTELCPFCHLIVENQVWLHLNEWRSWKSITCKVTVFRCVCSIVVLLGLPSLSKRRVRITATKSHIKMLLRSLKNFAVTPPRKCMPSLHTNREAMTNWYEWFESKKVSTNDRLSHAYQRSRQSLS